MCMKHLNYVRVVHVSGAKQGKSFMSRRPAVVVFLLLLLFALELYIVTKWSIPNSKFEGTRVRTLCARSRRGKIYPFSFSMCSEPP